VQRPTVGACGDVGAHEYSVGEAFISDDVVTMLTARCEYTERRGCAGSRQIQARLVSRPLHESASSVSGRGIYLCNSQQCAQIRRLVGRVAPVSEMVEEVLEVQSGQSTENAMWNGGAK
jgi:hypothetical protein